MVLVGRGLAFSVLVALYVLSWFTCDRSFAKEHQCRLLHAVASHPRPCCLVRRWRSNRTSGLVPSDFTWTLQNLGVRMEGRTELFQNVTNAALAILHEGAIDYADANLQIDYSKQRFSFRRPFIIHAEIPDRVKDTITLSDLTGLQVETLLVRRFALAQPPALRQRLALDCNRFEDALNTATEQLPRNASPEDAKSREVLFTLHLKHVATVNEYMIELGFHRWEVKAAPSGVVNIVLPGPSFQLLVAAPFEWHLARVQRTNPLSTLKPTNEGVSGLRGQYYYQLKDAATGAVLPLVPARLSIEYGSGIYVFDSLGAYRVIGNGR
jgi:hypothetical protein